MVIPIIMTGGKMLSPSPRDSESATPTASASILVATAIGSIARGEKESEHSSSSFENDSRIIFAPIMRSSMNATQ